MKKLILVLAATLGMTIAAGAVNYTIDDSEIDALIENTVEAVTTVSFSDAMATAASNTFVSSEKSDAVATLICFFLGGFGIHRHYMGTSKFMWALYTFTFGGIFGIVPLVDFIVLLVNLVTDESSGQFYNNTRFFMWA